MTQMKGHIKNMVVMFFICPLQYVAKVLLHKKNCTQEIGNRGSIVGIATGYGLDDQGVGVRVPVRSRIFSMLSRRALGSTQPPIQWVLGVKQLGHEAGHSPPASARLKKMQICLHGIVLSWLSTRTTLPFFFTSSEIEKCCH
jgi:hypothetical protein